MQEAKQISDFKHLFSFPSPNKQHIFCALKKLMELIFFSCANTTTSRSHRTIRVFTNAKRKCYDSQCFTQSLTALHTNTTTTNSLSWKKIVKQGMVEQSFAVFGYHLFAFSFLFAKKKHFSLKSEKLSSNHKKDVLDWQVVHFALMLRDTPVWYSFNWVQKRFRPRQEKKEISLSKCQVQWRKKI